MDVLSRIEMLKKRRDWSEYRLSEESGISQTTISAWYNKGRSPTISSLEKICAAFGITLAQFFADENELVDLTPDQRVMLDNWCALSKSQKEALLALMQSIPDIPTSR